MRSRFRASKLVSLASLALACSACGASALDEDGDAHEGGPNEIGAAREAIIGGFGVDTSWRRMVGLVDVNGDCSGSLIHPDWVMTATHCLPSETPSAHTFAIPRADGSLSTRVGRNLVRMGTTDLSLVELAPASVSDPWPSVSRTMYSAHPSTLVGQTITCWGRGDTRYGSDGILTGFGEWRGVNKTVARIENGLLVVDSNNGMDTPVPGDSGGPCLFHDQTVAVVSNGEYDCKFRPDPFTCRLTITRVLNAKLTPTSAFAADIQNLPAVRQTLQVAGITNETNRRLLHAIRNPDGSWTRFRDVELEAGDIGTPAYTALRTNEDGETHVLAVNTLGDIFHTIRSAGGRWSSFGNVEAVAGNVGNAQKVAIAEVGNDMHVLATNSNGQLRHAIRFSNGGWQPFSDPETVAGDIGTVVDVAASGEGSMLHLCVRDANFHIHHTVRKADGTYIPFFDDTTDSSISLSCTFSGGRLQMLRVRQSGASRVLEHRTRTFGLWSDWGNVNAATGALLPFDQISSSDVGGDLHVLGSSAGRLYHAIRFASTTNWSTFGDVTAVTGVGIGFVESDSD